MPPCHPNPPKSENQQHTLHSGGSEMHICNHIGDMTSFLWSETSWSEILRISDNLWCAIIRASLTKLGGKFYIRSNGNVKRHKPVEPACELEWQRRCILGTGTKTPVSVETCTHSPICCRQTCLACSDDRSMCLPQQRLCPLSLQ